MPSLYLHRDKPDTAATGLRKRTCSLGTGSFRSGPRRCRPVGAWRAQTAVNHAVAVKIKVPRWGQDRFVRSARRRWAGSTRRRRPSSAATVNVKMKTTVKFCQLRDICRDSIDHDVSGQKASPKPLDTDRSAAEIPKAHRGKRSATGTANKNPAPQGTGFYNQLERVTGLEPADTSLGSWGLTTWRHPLVSAPVEPA